MPQLSIAVKQRKRGRPATGQTPLVGIRLSEDLQSALVNWAEQQGDRPSRSEAIRQILTDYLKRRGFLKADETASDYVERSHLQKAMKAYPDKREKAKK